MKGLDILSYFFVGQLGGAPPFLIFGGRSQKIFRSRLRTPFSLWLQLPEITDVDLVTENVLISCLLFFLVQKSTRRLIPWKHSITFNYLQKHILRYCQQAIKLPNPLLKFGLRSCELGLDKIKKMFSTFVE